MITVLTTFSIEGGLAALVEWRGTRYIAIRYDTKWHMKDRGSAYRFTYDGPIHHGKQLDLEPEEILDPMYAQWLRRRREAGIPEDTDDGDWAVYSGR